MLDLKSRADSEDVQIAKVLARFKERHVHIISRFHLVQRKFVLNSQPRSSSSKWKYMLEY